MRREDGSNRMGLGAVRDMRAVGTVREPGKGGGNAPAAPTPTTPAQGGTQPERPEERREKPGRKSPMFTMAKPTFTPKAPVVDQAKAQTPEFKITPDAFRNRTKLSEIIERHKKVTPEGATPVKKRTTTFISAEEDANKKGNRSGGLDDIRRERARRRQTGRPRDEDDDRIVKSQKRHRR